MKSNWKKIVCGTSVLCVASLGTAHAALLDSSLLKNRDVAGLVNSRADLIDYIGLGEQVYVLKGNVYIPFHDLTIYADSAIIDRANMDIEAAGNIRVFRMKSQNSVLTIEQVDAFQANPNVDVQILGYETDTLGEQKVRVKLTWRGEVLKAEKIHGNIATGAISFENMTADMKSFVCQAMSGTRDPDGKIHVKDALLTNCEYQTNDQGHYSVSCGEATLYPHETNGFGVSGDLIDTGEYSIWGYNCALRIYGMPVIWLPVFYKPKAESPGLFQIQMGENSDWGYYFLMSKRFDLTDNPASSVRLLFDYYTMRGVGYGMNADVAEPNSRTEISTYTMYDLRPYYSSDVENYRLEIPHWRYNFRLTNITHITPRLDFRGNFSLLSDYYFLDDFFSSEFNADPEPATFAALEYQFDRFSTSLYVRPRVNTFFTTVERLPEFRIDTQRQQLFGTDLYYQNNMSVDYLQMRWREFDRRRPGNLEELKDYQSARFDTTHFLYYPLQFKKYGLEELKWLNIIPRIGGRFTAYSDSTDSPISTEDLMKMFLVNSATDNSRLSIRNYDNRGGSQARFIGEAGVEANTKFSYAWQNVRNVFWRLDGLRHVVEPYVNYTYIPEPTVDREYLYYFDDIDRIDRQNFIRLGVINRLQTRRGSFGHEVVYDWLRMENYYDYFMRTDNGFNNGGDFCTKITFNPTQRLSLSTFFSIDAGGNNDHEAEAIRRGREAGRPGISNSWLNRWNVTAKYELFQDCTISLSYLYHDAYATRSTYSMGSTLTDLESGTAFDKYYWDRSQQLRTGITVPLWTDRTFFGSYDIFYDFEMGMIREQRVRLMKVLHCWTVAAEFAQDVSYDSDGDKDYDYSFFVTAYLNGLYGPTSQAQSQAVAAFRTLQGGN